MNRFSGSLKKIRDIIAKKNKIAYPVGTPFSVVRSKDMREVLAEQSGATLLSADFPVKNALKAL